jgi:hypothetical protein
MRERGSQYGNFVPDADAAEPSLQRKPGRVAVGNEPTQRLV